MLLNGTDLLAVANRHQFAVPAFNVSDYAMMNGLFEISEEKKAPLIIAIHPDELSHIGVDMMRAVIARAERSSVPTTIHFDHGATYQQILLAIRNGFTSVMIDGSMLPFEENVALESGGRSCACGGCRSRASWEPLARLMTRRSTALTPSSTPNPRTLLPSSTRPVLTPGRRHWHSPWHLPGMDEGGAEAGSA
jgi:hypothetical protein